MGRPREIIAPLSWDFIQAAAQHGRAAIVLPASCEYVEHITGARAWLAGAQILPFGGTSGGRLRWRPTISRTSEGVFVSMLGRGSHLGLAAPFTLPPSAAHCASFEEAIETGAQPSFGPDLARPYPAAILPFSACPYRMVIQALVHVGDPIPSELRDADMPACDIRDHHNCPPRPAGMLAVGHILPAAQAAAVPHSIRPRRRLIEQPA